MTWKYTRRSFSKIIIVLCTNSIMKGICFILFSADRDVASSYGQERPSSFGFYVWISVNSNCLISIFSTSSPSDWARKISTLTKSWKGIRAHTKSNFDGFGLPLIQAVTLKYYHKSHEINSDSLPPKL